ncbi:bestrophin-like domain [Streptomyces sp. BBFR2]|uniref:bestrophin-like domain n=1 Tax=Streptomyces sp. BBFR2 TaxID=3372854 RepID=UPI0037DA685D
MSQWLVLAIAMAAACGVVLAITVLKQRRIGDDDDPSETPDVIEYMTMMVGVVYAIVLGLAIAGVWEARGAAEDTVRTEAQALHEISERARVYDPAVRDRIRTDVDRYVTYVVRKEWPVMADRGEITDRGTELLGKVRADVTDHRARDSFEEQSYQPLTDQVAVADGARNARADAAGSTLPSVVWFGLITGAVVTVGLIFTLQIRRSGKELLMAGLFSALIAFLLFLVWDLDAPFSRGLAAGVDSFTALFPHAG